MKTIRTLALATALSLSIPAGGAFAQALSRDVGVPLQEAQSLASRGQLSAAAAKVRAARSAADTSAERRKVTEMSAYVNTAARNYSAAASDLASIGAPASRLAPLYYQAENYDKAIELGRQMGGTNGLKIVAQSYIKTGNSAEAAKIYQDLIDQNGPQVEYLENLASAQFKMDDKQAYLQTIERLIRADPQPMRWRALLNNLKGESLTRDSKLALYKLLAETDNITRPEDYVEFAKFATVAQEPGVARNVVQAGIEGGELSDEDPQVRSLLNAADKRHAQVVAEFPTLKRGPEGYFRAANALFGEGDYRAAAVAYWRSYKMQKDIASSPYSNQALIGAGISALRAGDPAMARKAFALVEDNSAFREVAALWSLYAETTAS
ncbi:tetratricopeptide repeat protein [Pacificimonas sp. ICDLI1SI03]